MMQTSHFKMEKKNDCTHFYMKCKHHTINYTEQFKNRNMNMSSYNQWLTYERGGEYWKFVSFYSFILEDNIASEYVFK